MSWLFLAGAILAEVVATTALKASDGFTRPLPVVVLGNLGSVAYFQGDYLKQAEWAELWRQCLRIDYRPVVDIRTVKLDLVQSSQRVNKPPARMWEAVAEILKYAVKPSDMIRDHEWFGVVGATADSPHRPAVCGRRA